MFLDEDRSTKSNETNTKPNITKKHLGVVSCDLVDRFLLTPLQGPASWIVLPALLPFLD